MPNKNQAIIPGVSHTAGTPVKTQVETNLPTPQIPETGVQTYTEMGKNGNEFSDPTDSKFQATGDYSITQTATAESVGSVKATEAQAATYDASLIGEGAAGSEQAATATELTPAATAEAALGEIPESVLVQSQMEELTKGLESGDIPLWAKPASDAVEQQLAARGLSRSSIGQAALTNAIIQAALPMAQQNAQATHQNFMQNKANQQQTNLFNAQAGQQLQLQSLNNEQQMSLANLQVKQESMLSDQAAQNAAKQFNSASENQTQQFMSNLKANIDLTNAARLDAMSQFNAGQENAMSQFNSNIGFARDQFNAQNATMIEQSNLQWRRQINQMDTAGTNAVNQANAMNAFNLSNQSLTFLWQEMRDEAKWAFEATQNDAQRAAALAQAALSNEAATDAARRGQIEALGQAAINIWKNW